MSAFPQRLNSPFGRLSTGIKMLIILTTALLPLGLIALFASIESAHVNRLNREAATRFLAIDSGRRLDGVISRTAITLRAAATALSGNPDDPRNCQRTLESLAASHRFPVDFAIFAANGELLCATHGFVPAMPDLPAAGGRVEIGPDGDILRIFVSADRGVAGGVAELSRATIVDTSHPRAIEGSYRLTLRQGPRSMPLARADGSMLSEGMTTTLPLADNQLSLEMTSLQVPVTATEILLVLLPILMLIAAATIGWLVVDRLVLRPLTQLQGAVSAYRAGDNRLALPILTTPSHEIRELGDAFRRVTETIARHETELEEGLARQTKLTREVHHRVKNNLQVVASLLNLHARGAPSPDAADAYAAIQRRVDALAVVHRNHYAELEENRGVALRPLISELAANLRATAPAAAASMAIGLDIRPYYVTQDVAVPVAFLVTELVETAMLAETVGSLTIALSDTPTDGRARLSVIATGLKGAATPAGRGGDRVSRVVEGLARQLRAPLVRDDDKGCLSIEIAVVGTGEN